MDLAPQIKTFARELQSRYNHAQISSIGTTHEGRPIEMVTASLNDGARRAGIVIDCGVHAREWVSPSFCMYALEQLLRGGKGRFTCDVRRRLVRMPQKPFKGEWGPAVRNICRHHM